MKVKISRSSHSRLPGRLTRGFQGSAARPPFVEIRKTENPLPRGYQGVSLEIPGSGRPFVKNLFFDRKIDFFIVKMIGKNPEIFVHITPEKTWKNQLSEKISSKNSFNISSGRFRSKLKPPQSPIILNLTKWKKKNRPPGGLPDPPLTSLWPPKDSPGSPQSQPESTPKWPRVDPGVAREAIFGPLKSWFDKLDR